MITKKDQKALQNNIAILMLIFSVVAIFFSRPFIAVASV